MTVVLRDYQKEALEKLDRGWNETHGTRYARSQLVVMATGLGKTVLFSEASKLSIAKNQKVLILAHREELLEQAYEKLQKHVPEETRIEFEQGPRYASPDAQVVIASVPSLANDTRLQRFSEDHFDLVIVDEAHHATASTYQKILDWFCNSKVLGVTATPRRRDGESLTRVFDRIAYRLDISSAIRAGLVCPIRCHRVGSQTDMRGIRVTAGDYNLKDLSEKVNNTERNSLIVSSYLRGFNGRQAIVYATNLDHAEALCSEFLSEGISCVRVSGDMPKDERRWAIQAFKEGNIKVITNYGVLTEGFDYPKLDLIISARPTTSLLLLTQIIGRGTRLFPTKECLDVLEITDLHSENTVSVSEIFGLERHFDPGSHLIPSILKEMDDTERSHEGFNPWASFSIENCRARLKLFLDRGKENQPDQDGRIPKVTHRFEWFRHSTDTFVFSKRNQNLRIHSMIIRNALGAWVGEVTESQDRADPVLKISGSLDSLQEMVTLIEDYLSTQWPDAVKLWDIHAPWRKRAAQEPCTEKQFYWIQKMNLSRLPIEQISKAEAIRLLDKAFNKR